LEISKEKSIWSTQSHNEQKLNEAYDNSDVILIFSVNNSRHFQGYARMASRIGREFSSLWSLDGGAHFGGVFKVEWITLYDLPFSETLHIRNPLNNNKPVKISRDGQELSHEIGEQLCTLFDEGATIERNKRKTSGVDDDGHQSKKAKITTSEFLVKDDKDNKEKESFKDLKEKGENKSREDLKSSSHRASSISYYNSSRSSENRTHDSEYNRNSRNRNYSSSRHSPSRRNVDLLNMTYEDYLTALGQLNNAFGLPEVDYYSLMQFYSKHGFHDRHFVNSRPKR